MSIPTKLDTKITDGAKRRMLDFLASTSVENPVLCLTKGRVENEENEKWIFGTYGPENIEAIEPMMKAEGHPLLYEIQGIVFAIPQFHLINELKGKTIEDGGDRLLIY